MMRYFPLVSLLCLAIIGFSAWFIFAPMFISDDSYFYLVIARNIVQFQSQSFSGISTTNGIHPLWLYLLSLWSWFINLVQPLWLFEPRSIVLLPLLLVAAGSILIWWTAQRLGLSAPVFLSISMGYVLAFGILGSEGHLSYFTLALLLFVATNKRNNETKYGIILGIVNSLVFLTRLDMVFLVGIFYLWHFLTYRKLRASLLAAIVTAIPAAIYMLSNLIFFGGLTPVSGWLKSTAPEINLRGISFTGLTSSISGYNILSGIIPCLVAMFILAYLLGKHRLKKELSIVIVFVLGSLAHWGYVALFTSGYTNWPWYYIAPVMSLSFTIALLFHDLSLNSLIERIFVGTSSFAFIALIGIKVLTWTPTLGDVLLVYLKTNQIENQTLLVSDYPGLVAYYSTNHVIAADMLMANRQFISNLENSSNAFDTIAEEARSQGIELDYVIWIGNERWLKPREDNLQLTYFHPRYADVIIGQLSLESPIFDDRTIPLIVWEYPER